MTHSSTVVGARIMHGYQHGKVLQEGGRHGPAQANGSRKEGDQIKYAVVGVGKHMCVHCC